MPADGLILANGQDANVRRRRWPGSTAPIETVAIDAAAAIAPGCTRHWASRTAATAAKFASTASRSRTLTALGARASTICSTPRWPWRPARPAGSIRPQRPRAVGDFTGVDRRMTEVGRCNGAIVVDDYGHHPTEIRATLKALREKYQPERLFCVFQPHQHSRTRFLLDDFATSFAAADETIVPDIYFVRDSEAERQRVSTADLVERIIDNGQDAMHICQASSESSSTCARSSRRRRDRDDGRGQRVGNRPRSGERRR